MEQVSSKPPIRQTTRDRVLWFGAAIRAEREGQGLTAAELAERAGLRAATVYDVENGVTSVSLAVAVKLMAALDVSLDVRGERVRYLRD